jgi:hypothetical protein
MLNGPAEAVVHPMAMGSQVSLVLSDQSGNDPGLVFFNYK